VANDLVADTRSQPDGRDLRISRSSCLIRTERTQTGFFPSVPVWPCDPIPQLTVGSWLTTDTDVSFVPRNRTSFFPVARSWLPDTRGRTKTIALNKFNHAHCLTLNAKQRQVLEVLVQLSTRFSLKLKLQTARAVTVYLPALRTAPVSFLTTLNCWDYTASPDRTLLMNKKRRASGHVTSQAGKHVVRVTGTFCNSTRESKRKHWGPSPGLPNSTAFTVIVCGCAVGQSVQCTRTLSNVTHSTAPCLNTDRDSVGGRLSITVDHTRCSTVPAASARTSLRTVSRRPL